MASNPAQRTKCRTTPDPATITQIKGYPSKLIIYLCAASSYWQIRYFAAGTYHKKTSGTSVKQDAIEAAKRFYDDINFKLRFGPQNKHELFEQQAIEWLKVEQARATRGQITDAFFTTLVKRFNKHVSPYFSGKLVKEIKTAHLEQFLAALATEGLKADTQKGYLNIVFSVLKHAYENDMLNKLPKRPKLHIEDNPSDYFNEHEMRLLIDTAKAMAGEKVRIEQGKANKHGTRPKRMVLIMPDFWRLIEFMFYSFIRPSDIRVLQHKHVEVKENEHTYLKLTHPPTKKHGKPISTMSEAVPLYLEQLEYQKSRGFSAADDFVFVPEKTGDQRKYVPDILAKQFKQVLIRAGLDVGKDEARRVLYSIRHSSIMDRLVHGDTVDVNAIAQNARTSTEMIDRFYGSRLEGEMNIGKIQSDIRQKQPEKSEQLSGGEHVAGWDRDLAKEIESLQLNPNAPKLVVVGGRIKIQE